MQGYHMDFLKAFFEKINVRPFSIYLTFFIFEIVGNFFWNWLWSNLATLWWWLWEERGGGIWSSFHQNGFVGLRVCFLSFRSAVPNQGYWKISRGTPDFHQLKIYTDIFNDNVISHKSLEVTRGYTSFIFSAWGYVSRKKVWNRCFRSIYNQLQCIMSQ